MAHLPSKSDILTLRYAHRGRPFVAISPSTATRTLGLGYALKGRPFALGDVPLPVSSVPRSSGPPFPPITVALISDGSPGTYFRALGSGMSNLVFPAIGGIGTWTIRFFVRRPVAPVIPTGVLFEIGSGDSSLTLTVNSDDTLTVSVTDGTTTVEGTTPQSFIGLTWTGITATHDAGDDTLTLYFDTQVGVVLDTSTLTVDPSADDDFTIFADNDGLLQIDGWLVGWSAYTVVLTEEHIDALQQEEWWFDPGNPVGDGSVWDGTTTATTEILYVEAESDGAIPNAGSGSEVDVLVPAQEESEGGGGAEASPPEEGGGDGAEVVPPEKPERPIPRSKLVALCGIRGFGSPSRLGKWTFRRRSGFGTPSELAGEESTLLGGGFGDPPWYGFQQPQTCNPPPLAWLPVYPIILQSPEIIVGQSTFGDEGGELVSLYASGGRFPLLGPYTVRLIAQDGTYWPPGGGGCYSVIAGQGDSCRTNLSREWLTFGLPPLPEGLYDVELSWGLSRITVPQSILIVRRNAIRERDRMNRAFA